MPRPTAGDDEAPLAKAGNMRVVGRGGEADGFNRCRHRPKALSSDQGRGGLNHGIAAGGEAFVQQRVKRVGVKLADGEIGRIGEVDNDDIEGV